jgi:HSP20 family protein
MTMTQHEQKVPVRVYQTDDRIMLAAPMPGLEPQNIAVTITGDRVIIHGELRGPGQERREMLMEEWTVGPYRREVSLPCPVDGNTANATYGNGVLVLSMPKAQGQQGGYTQIQLTPVDATRGQHVGHSGSEVTPSSTGEHRQNVQQSGGK